MGPLLLGEARAAMAAVSRGFDPTIYAGAPSWRQGLEDAVQEYVTSVLLEERQIEYIILTAQTLADIQGLLRFHARRSLARHRQRSVIDNLLDRADPILARAPFRHVAGRPGTYLLDGEDPLAPAPTGASHRAAARAVATIPRVPPARGDRAPIVYATEVLTDLLIAVARCLAAPFSLRDLDAVLRLVLTDWVATFLSEDEVDEASQPAPQLGPEDVGLAMEAVSVIMEVWSEQDRLIMGAKLAGVSDQALAGSLNVSRPVLAARKHRAVDAMREPLLGLAPAVQQRVIEEISLALSRSEP